jgi:hypothetical protein
MMARKDANQAKDAQAAHSQDCYEEAAHVLPKWVNYIIENWLLTCLLLAEAYLLGTLMTLGWVKDIEAPSQWDWYHFNFLGLLVFSSVEIWASLSERSSNLLLTPADKAVLSAFNANGAPICDGGVTPPLCQHLLRVQSTGPGAGD